MTPDEMGELWTHHAQVRRVAFKFLRDEDDADDVTMAALLRVIPHLPRVERALWPRYWKRAVTNICIERYRQSQKRQFIAGDVPPEEGSATVFDLLPSHEPPLCAAMEREQTRRDVRDALAKVPLTQRSLLVGYHFGGVSVVELASRFALNENTVKSRLTRGRLHMAQSLTKREGWEDLK